MSTTGRSIKNVYERGLRLPQKFGRPKEDRELINTLLESAKNYYKSCEYTKTIESYRQALELDLNRKSAALLQCYIARCYYMMDDLVTAETCISEAYKMDSNGIEIKITRGVICMCNDKVEVNKMGVDWLKKAYMMDRKNPTVLYHLSLHYFFIDTNLAEVCKYLEIIEKVIEDDYAQEEHVYKLRINSCLCEKYQNLIADPSYPIGNGTRRRDLLISLADLNLRLDDCVISQTPFKMLEKVIEINPIHLKVLYYLANNAFNQKNYEEVELYTDRFKMFCNFQAKCQVYPSLHDIRFWEAKHKHFDDMEECAVNAAISLVEMHLDFKRYQFNVFIGINWELLRKSYQLLPNHPVLIYHLANVSFFKELYKDVYELTIKSHVYIQAVLTEKFNYYHAMYDEVLDKLDESTIANPELTDALIALAALHSGSEMPMVKAIGFQLAQKAYDREKTNAIVLYHLAIISFINRKYSEVDYFSKRAFLCLTSVEHFEHKLIADNFIRNMYKKAMERTLQDTNSECIQGAQGLLKLLSINRLPEHGVLSALVYEKLNKHWNARPAAMEGDVMEIN